MAKDSIYHVVILNDKHGDSYLVAITNDPWGYKEMHYPSLTETSDSKAEDLEWIDEDAIISLRAVAISNKAVQIPISEAMVNRLRGM